MEKEEWMNSSLHAVVCGWNLTHDEGDMVVRVVMKFNYCGENIPALNLRKEGRKERRRERKKEGQKERKRKKLMSD